MFCAPFRIQKCNIVMKIGRPKGPYTLLVRTGPSYTCTARRRHPAYNPEAPCSRCYVIDVVTCKKTHGSYTQKETICFCHLKQTDVKDIHVGQETGLGLLVDSSTVLAILYGKYSMRMKLSSEVYFAWISHVSSHSLNLCTAAVNLDLNGRPVHTTRIRSG